MHQLASADMLNLTRAALTLLLVVAGPMLLTALIVGVVIGLLQALTQIQEMTLTFVPKLLGIGVVMLLSLPIIGQAMSAFMLEISHHIVGR